MSETTRSKAEIEAEIAAARERLAASVEGLFMQVHPKAVVANTVSEARAFVANGAQTVKAELVNVDGSLRIERVGLIAAAVAGSLAFLATVRSILRR
ncbi:MAG TPA: DUF3618 domain-containing protein [Propionicimonas sp.]|nr:DUF3618 domain-containing protein [Propionicimonas sp.]